MNTAKLNAYLAGLRLYVPLLALSIAAAVSAGCRDSTFPIGSHSDKWAAENEANNAAVLEHFEGVGAEIQKSQANFDQKLDELALK